MDKSEFTRNLLTDPVFILCIIGMIIIGAYSFWKRKGK
jgi:hypothetical protein